MDVRNTSTKSTSVPRRSFLAVLGGLVTLLLGARRNVVGGGTSESSARSAVETAHHNCLICQARHANFTS